MKRTFMLFIAFLMAFGAINLATSNDAQAQVSVELVGKLGGEANFFDNEWLGDTNFDVSGGLRLSGIVRFANNFGIGLNFNWTMSSQSVTSERKNDLPAELNDYGNREAVIQHPSFGVMLRYLIIDMVDLGLWMNYGFGHVAFDPVVADTSMVMDPSTRTESQMYVNLAESIGYCRKESNATDCWDLGYGLQTFELGLLGHVRWYIPDTTFAVIVGAEMFLNFSRMTADDSRLRSIQRGNKRGYDKNSMNSFGIQFVFGVGYDFYFDSFGKQQH